MKKVLLFLSMLFLMLGSFSFSGKMNEAKAEETFPQGEQYEKGAYDFNADQPMGYNWDFNSIHVGSEKNGVKWSKKINYLYYKNSTIDSDGTIYTVSEKTLFAFNRDGSEKWKHEFNTLTYSSPVLNKNGSILINADGVLHSLNKNGELEWKSEKRSYGEISIDSDGNIYTFSRTNYSDSTYIQVYNQDGSYKWNTTIKLPGDYNNSQGVQVSKSGNIYFLMSSGRDLRLYSFSKDGKLNWSTNEKLNVSSFNDPHSFILGSDNKIYIVVNQNIFIFNAEGTLEKTVPIEEQYSKGLAISKKDKSLYVSTKKGLLVLDSKWEKKWFYQTKYAAENLIIDKNDNVFFNVQHDGMYSLGSEGKVNWYQKLEKQFNLTGPISMDKYGILYTTQWLYNDKDQSEYHLTAIGQDRELEPKPKPEEDICLKPSVCKEINTFINNAYNFRAGDYEFKHEQFYDIDKCRNKIVFQFDGDDPKILEQKARHRGDIEHWMNKEGLSTKDMTFIWKDVKNDKVLLEEKPSSK